MKKRVLCVLAFYGVSACASTTGADSADEASYSWDEALAAEISDQWASPEYRAFDFWIGEWEANWRPKPAGEFHHAKEGNWTRQRVFPILGGKALIELAWSRDNPDEPSGRGFSIRYFDTARERWVMAQNWPNPNSGGGAFTDQLIGDEHLGRLTMYSVTKRRNSEGEVVSEHRRYNFTDVRPGVSFRWDGSNTSDQGATWFTWNVVDFLRRRDLDPFGAAGTPFPGVHQKNLCTDEPHGAFNDLEGVWTGEMTDAEGGAFPARYSAGLALDGCGVLGVLDAGGVKTFLAVGYMPRQQKWVFYRLDDRPGTPHGYFVSVDAGEGATFVHAPGLSIKDEFTAYNEPESYAPEGALRRVVWDAFTADELRLRVETRTAPGADWETEATYSLEKR